MTTRSPRALSRLPRLLAVKPFPSEEATPPVTKTCLVVRDDSAKGDSRGISGAARKGRASTGVHGNTFAGSPTPGTGVSGEPPDPGPGRRAAAQSANVIGSATSPATTGTATPESFVAKPRPAITTTDTSASRSAGTSPYVSRSGAGGRNTRTAAITTAGRAATV